MIISASCASEAEAFGLDDEGPVEEEPVVVPEEPLDLSRLSIVSACLILLVHHFTYIYQQDLGPKTAWVQIE